METKMTRFYREPPGFNYHAMTVNKGYLTELSKLVDANFTYNLKDQSIKVSFNGSFTDLYDTRFEYVYLTKRDILQIVRREIYRLDGLSCFNPNIKNLKELQALEKQICQKI